MSGAGIVTDALLSTADNQTDASGLVQATGGRVRPVADAASLPQLVAAEATVIQPAIAVTATVPSALAGRSVPLTVSIDGTSLTASTTVTFPHGAPPPDSGPVSTALSRIPAWVGFASAAVLFIALVMAVLGVVWPRSLKHERIRQISNFGPGGPGRRRQGAREQTDHQRHRPYGVWPPPPRWFGPGGWRSGSRRRLERAGMRMRPHEWVLLRACIVITARPLLFAWPRASTGRHRAP